MADHFFDDEAQKLFRKVRIQLRGLRDLAQSRDLLGLASRIGWRQTVLCFVMANGLRDFETLGQQTDQGGVNIVDALPIGVELCVAHDDPPSIRRLLWAREPKRKRRLLPLAARRSKGSPMGQVTPLRRNQPASLDPMMKLVAGDMHSVNTVILARMQSDVPLIPELAGHLIAGGGKRMRPMLTLACARLLDYQGTRHHTLAAAVEFIHTATLLHDDVVDFLFSRAFELMVEDGSLRVLRILSNASAVIAEGEVNQLTAQRQIATSEARYLDIIGAKTAALFAAACRIASVVAERDEQVEEALDAYGRNLGIAFQLVDDAIDYASDEATMGKDAGDDFRDGKVTLPVILAHARGSEADRRFWREAMEGRRTSDDDLARAVQLLNETNAIADTQARARHYGQLAIDALSGLGTSTARAALVEAVEFAVARAY
jgi:octaprenyl-diphosphate synthase